MASKTFDPIAYLNGLTRFVFEKDALENIAYERGLMEVSVREEIDEYTKDHCLISLYELVVFGPWSVASSQVQHGNFSHTIGSETITAAQIESIKRRLAALYNKYGEETDIDTGNMAWVNENDFDE